MGTFFTLGGKPRPIHFGWGALYQYESQSGRSPIDDFARVQTGSVSITMLVNLLYCGFVCGYRAQNMEIDFDEFTVAGWIDEDPSIVQRGMDILAASFPAAEPQKKTVPIQPKSKARAQA